MCLCRSRVEALTVQQLVDQNKIVLDGFLVKLAKVAFPELDKPVEELKHQRGVGIALCDCDEINVLVLDVAKGRAAESEDRGADLGVGYNLDAKDVG